MWSMYTWYTHVFARGENGPQEYKANSLGSKSEKSRPLLCVSSYISV
jgi:hypothetical protein